MLDDAILDQLRTHFASLAAELAFVVNPSEHEKQG